MVLLRSRERTMCDFVFVTHILVFDENLLLNSKCQLEDLKKFFVDCIKCPFAAADFVVRISTAFLNIPYHKTSEVLQWTCPTSTFLRSKCAESVEFR